MRRLAAFVVERRWWVLAASALFIPLAAFAGGGVARRLSVGGMQNPAAESPRTANVLERYFGTGPSNFVVVVRARRGTVDDPAVAAAARQLTQRLQSTRGVTEVISYWNEERPPPLRSRDGRSGLILARIAGGDDTAVKAAGTLAPRFTRYDAAISTRIGGTAETRREITKQAEEDLHQAEAITAPLTFVALLVVFGSLVAALLPLGVAMLAVLGSFSALTIIARITQVSVFSLNLITALGLGLAIDYSLFIVSRYREELRQGFDVPVAITHTMLTAGRTVSFSAATVGLSLAALVVFPMAYLRSFAFAGVAVVALAGIAAVIVLPALLAVLGPRVEKGRVWRRPTDRPEYAGFWYRQAHRVMRRPVTYAAAVVGVLVVLAMPFLHLQVGLADDRVVPPSVPARAVNDSLRADYNTRESNALGVLATGGTHEPTDAQVDAFAARVSRTRGVSRVDARTGYFIAGHRVKAPDGLSARFIARSRIPATWFSVVPSIEPVSPQGEQLVQAIRRAPAPFAVSVTGLSAKLVDTKHDVITWLPVALGLIALTTFALLFLMVGSFLVPAKALLLNLLSLTATFGAMVWIFQDGRLAGILDYTPTGTIDVFTPILMFCVAFGLSMDYEVFLLSRIKEEYDLKGDNQEAVALGLQRTGRSVTAAALLLALVFAAFSTSKVEIVKLFGVGLTLAVLVDAFLIRATLVPAFMRLAGRANWWAPGPVRRWHLRWGIWEAEPIKILDLPDGIRPSPTRPAGRNTRSKAEQRPSVDPTRPEHPRGQAGGS